ncbi:alpha-tocopherol transfer protein-like [Teleopsis dalmanni]|uniref:alpha-tocopherol transfer protein-like n=1 Tax=Teleopsis dalmanni TaxID=139649 RepID=UPI0018CDD624|nr:alpha-tocopherol transfer protein-like [Teleopsis dalmanni]
MKHEVQIPENVQKTAKRELREDKSTREQSLEQFRNWIRKNKDLHNVRDDDTFLLRFLRAKKFSVPMAEQTLLKYLNIRRTFPHMSTELDHLSVTMNDIITNGYIFASPRRDKNGRRVVIINAKGFNPKMYTSSDQAKAHFLTYECLMEDQETQITGITHIGDFSGVMTAHVTNWNPTEFAKVFKWGEQSLPMRHKEIHLVNVPSTLKWLIDFVKNRVSSKIRDRLTIYTNEADLVKTVDAHCLPRELGGEIPMKAMIQMWKAELASKREMILRIDNSKLLSDRGIQGKGSYTPEKASNGTNFVSQIESIAGSFRKLEFD